ncbi:sugar transferase [Schleiferilactobacillus harbinensis]|uniref:sugar transferase n=1 Tax=Schleiferilactobacillus harbinensis TaxID=304207 RepID=UPI00116DDD01|nr:sugar transferase [Schleiferilactobacillus harbinensis]GEK07723.1 multidrug MFS transporter [Schleiferilactobacillus harbinensis]
MENYLEKKQHAVVRSATIDQDVLANQHVYLTLKRSFDFIASGLALVILSPLFLLLAILIKVDDRGPVFFSQIRIGKDGSRFRMYKFRSMGVDAEKQLAKLVDKNEIDGPMFKMKHDPRVTRIGRFIRKTSLDELPQLYNVLRGDMSLVGPRPCLPREYVEYSDYDKQRLLVTPGCTGLWQVSGRNALSFSQMVNLDLQYITHRSILNDIIILFRTVKVIFMPNQAY